MPRAQPMSSPAKGRSAYSKSASMRLLPLPTEITCGLLIEYHMTLANLRQGHGDARHFSTMAGVIIITCCLIDAGYGEACPDAMAEVQEALVRCNRIAEATGVYGVDEATFHLLADLLTLHELQMRSAPFHVVEKANKRQLQLLSASSAGGADIHKAA
jgi:hypothetical protein